MGVACGAVNRQWLGSGISADVDARDRHRIIALMDCVTALERFSRRLDWRRIARTYDCAVLVAISASVLLVASCGGGEAPDEAPDTVSPGFPVTAERADGGTLTFDRPPQRIVSLSPGLTEILFAIGVGDQIIAVDSGSDFPGETEGKTKIDATTPDMETLTGLEPDLVITMGGPVDVVQSLDQLGLQVLWLETPDSFGGILDQIDVLGEITGRIEESDSLVDDMDSRVLTIFDKVGATAGPRIYHELDDQLVTASSDTFTGELYLILNATNVTDIVDETQRPYPQLTLGAIVEADPEVIILAYSGASPESIEARPGWQSISAVQNDRIYAVDPDIVNRPGPRLVEGLETLANLLHPDLFPEP